MTNEAKAVPIAYGRDIDGTGSIHICAKGDPGYIELYPATEVERLEASLADAKTRLANLYEAAERYFDRYCQDEASDEVDDNGRGMWTGCPERQIRDAIALRDALEGAAQP